MELVIKNDKIGVKEEIWKRREHKWRGRQKLRYTERPCNQRERGNTTTTVGKEGCLENKSKVVRFRYLENPEQSENCLHHLMQYKGRLINLFRGKRGDRDMGWQGQSINNERIFRWRIKRNRLCSEGLPKFLRYCLRYVIAVNMPLYRVQRKKEFMKGGGSLYCIQ